MSDCKVTATSKSPLLDETTCGLMSANGRFTPPRDKKGKPTVEPVELVGTVEAGDAHTAARSRQSTPGCAAEAVTPFRHGPLTPPALCTAGRISQS